MENILKLRFELNDELLKDLSVLDDNDLQIIKQKKLSGLETVLLITALINLTESSLKLVTAIVEKFEAKKIIKEISLNDENIDYKKLNKLKLKKKRKRK